MCVIRLVSIANNFIEVWICWTSFPKHIKLSMSHHCLVVLENFELLSHLYLSHIEYLVVYMVFMCLDVCDIREVKWPSNLILDSIFKTICKFLSNALSYIENLCMLLLLGSHPAIDLNSPLAHHPSLSDNL